MSYWIQLQSLKSARSVDDWLIWGEQASRIYEPETTEELIQVFREIRLNSYDNETVKTLSHDRSKVVPVTIVMGTIVLEEIEYKVRGMLYHNREPLKLSDRAMDLILEEIQKEL